MEHCEYSHPSFSLLREVRRALFFFPEKRSSSSAEADSCLTFT